MEEIVEQLKALNAKTDTIISIMKAPQKFFSKMLQTVGAVVSVLSILSVIDIIKNWIVGG